MTSILRSTLSNQRYSTTTSSTGLDLHITVRGATASDVTHIALLTSEVQDLHARSYPDLFKTKVPASELEAVVDQHLGEGSQRVLVAIQTGVIVGYARFELQHRPETAIKFARAQLYIHELGVAHVARGRGVGTALMAHIEALARESGIRRIGVDVFVENEDARHFYEARGFATERELRWLTAEAPGGSDAPVL